MFQFRLRTISILLLALTLLFSAGLSFAAISQHATTSVAGHCVDQTNPSDSGPQQAFDCLGHCTLPAPLVDAPTAVQYRQQGLSLPPVRFLSIVQAPPSPPPKLSAV